MYVYFPMLLPLPRQTTTLIPSYPYYTYIIHHEHIYVGTLFHSRSTIIGTTSTLFSVYRDVRLCVLFPRFCSEFLSMVHLQGWGMEGHFVPDFLHLPPISVWFTSYRNHLCLPEIQVHTVGI